MEVLSGRNGEEWSLDKSPCCGQAGHKHGGRKFLIAADTGLWHCVRCDAGGNLFQFLRLTGQLEMATPVRDVWAGTQRGSELSKQVFPVRNVPSKVVPEKLIEAMISALWGGSEGGNEGLSYLREQRKFSDETIRRFRLGWTQAIYYRCSCGQEEKRRSPVIPAGGVVCRKCQGTIGAPTGFVPLISIPIYEDGKCVLVKYRGVKERCFEREYGCKSPLYGIDDAVAVGGKCGWKTIAITEAETDRISLEQYGVVGGPVISLTAGAKEGMLSALEPYRDALAPWDQILLALDNDEAGELCAAACAQILGQHRCYRVKLPFKDVNECLQAGVPEDVMRAAIEKATSYSANIVRHVSESRNALMLRFRNAGVGKPYKTGWVPVDDLLGGGIRGKEITVVTGDTGSGKSMFTKRLVLRMARTFKEEGRAVLLASLEDGVEATVRVLTGMAAGKLADSLTEERALEVFDREIVPLPIYQVGDWTDRSEIGDLVANIEWGVRRYGLWLVVIDHFHWVLPSAGDDERVVIERSLRLLKAMVDRTGIHLVLVVHPHKLQRGPRGQVLEPDLNDLKGSSEIKKVASNAIRVWRDRTANREESDRPRAVVTLLKVRYEGGREGSVPMWYDREACEYIPLTSEELVAARKKKRGSAEKPTGKEKKIASQAEADAPMDLVSGVFQTPDDEEPVI